MARRPTSRFVATIGAFGLLSLVAYAALQQGSSSAAAGDVWITALNCDSSPEYVHIKNFGGASQSLAGFRIQSDPSQDYDLAAHVGSIAAGQTLEFQSGTGAADNPGAGIYKLTGSNIYRNGDPTDYARLARSGAPSSVTSIVAPQGAVGYTYNNADQRATMVLPGSRTASYGYDTAGRLNSITDWQSRAIGFSYNADGQRTGITRPNGVNSTYAYDVAGRLTSVVHAGGGGTLQSFAYTLDAAGNRTTLTSLTGTENYTLDALNRLTNVTYPNGDVVSYTYDADGNRLTKTFNGTPTNYTYDNADQLTSDGSLTYTYDANGNMTAAGADTFTWDYANRMTGATVGGTATAYAYDGDDTRVRKTVAGTPTNYVWDREDGLPLLVDDGTNAYLQEDGALAQVNGAGTPEYLLGDALGSRRGVTNLTGTLTGTADYDAFGAVRTSSGTGSTFGYTGEQFDAETGYTYLRARYLNTALGRFTSADSMTPNAPGTQGYNLYAYVANNPTTWMDPSGHFAIAAAYVTMVQIVHPAFSASVQVWLQSVAAWFSGSALSGEKVNPAAGLGYAVGSALALTAITAIIFDCVSDSQCWNQSLEWASKVEQLGSFGTYDDQETWDKLKRWSKSWPWLPVPAIVWELVRRLADVRIDFGDPSGGGGGGYPTGQVNMHHVIPREILDNVLPKEIADDPRIRGAKGQRNRICIPKELHDSIHNVGVDGVRYNPAWRQAVEEVITSEGGITVEDVLAIKDELVARYGLAPYLP